MPQKIRPTNIPHDCTTQFLCQNIINEAIAYSSLKQRKQNFLAENYEILFKESAPPVVEGSKIYAKYFMNKIDEIKKVLNESSDPQEIKYCLQTLKYLTLDS